MIKTFNYIQLYLLQHNIPIEITDEIFILIPIPELLNLNIDLNSLIRLHNRIPFKRVIAPLNYPLPAIEKYKQIAGFDPNQWFLCNPLLFECYLQVYSKSLVQTLKQTRPGYSSTYVYCLVQHNRMDLLRLLYETSNDFLDDCNILDDAAYHGSFEMVKYLLHKGAKCSNTALNAASLHGYCDIVKVLCTERREWNYDVAKRMAVFGKRGQVVEYLDSI